MPYRLLCVVLFAVASLGARAAPTLQPLPVAQGEHVPPPRWIWRSRDGSIDFPTRPRRRQGVQMTTFPAFTVGKVDDIWRLVRDEAIKAQKGRGP